MPNKSGVAVPVRVLHGSPHPPHAIPLTPGKHRVSLLETIALEIRSGACLGLVHAQKTHSPAAA
jgi:hypothetical protein